MPQETMKCLYRFVVPQCVIQNEMRNEQFFSQFSVFWGWLVHMKCKTQGGGGGEVASSLPATGWMAVWLQMDGCLQMGGWVAICGWLSGDGWVPSGCRWVVIWLGGSVCGLMAVCSWMAYNPKINL